MSCRRAKTRLVRLFGGTLALVCSVVAAAATASIAPAASTVLSTRFEAGRVYVRAELASSKIADFLTDTGGGLVISIAAAQRLGLKLTPAPELKARLGPEARMCEAPVFSDRSGLPPLPLGAQMIAVPHSRQLPSWPDQGDGVLGQAWFAGHVWTWNYPAHQLILRPNGWRPKKAREAALGFKTDGEGKRELNFPSINVRVDGQTLPMLLDTGAETLLTQQALARIHDKGPAFRSASMVAHSIFERWHAAHPDWPVIDNAQIGTHSRMIRVQQVEVAGLEISSVWFTERPDANYHKFMSAMTDKQVEGSIGGNAFQRFAMTLDYPGARAWFLVPQR